MIRGEVEESVSGSDGEEQGITGTCGLEKFLGDWVHSRASLLGRVWLWCPRV